MKKKICLVQRHCESNEILLHYEGEAQIEEQERKLSIIVKSEEPRYELKIHAYADAMILHHHTMHDTKLSLRKGHQTNTHIENEMGSLTLQILTKQYEKRTDSVYVQYVILDQDQVCDTFELQIEMGGGMK